MDVKAEYTLGVAEVADLIDMQQDRVRKLAELPDDDPNYLPNYWRPRSNGYKDRSFRPADVAAWQERHGLKR